MIIFRKDSTHPRNVSKTDQTQDQGVKGEFRGRWSKVLDEGITRLQS